MPKQQQGNDKPPGSNRVKIVAVALIAAVVVLAALAVHLQKPSGLVGRWELQYEKRIEFWLGYEVVNTTTYDFWVELRGDGTGSFSDGFAFTWTADEGNITLTEIPPSSDNSSITFKYVLAEGTLTARRYIGDGITIEWVFRRS